MNDLIIAFSNPKASDIINNILKQNGIVCTHIVKTSSALRQVCARLDNAIIICNTNFTDEVIYSVIEDFYENFTFIVIGDYSQIDILDDNKCYKVCTPLKQSDLLTIIDLAIYKNSEKIKAINKQILNQAKSLLITKLNMTEEKAHRYIQKKSMDTGKNMLQICKLIIKKYID